LKTDKLRSRLDEQEIAGDVTVNINIAGGTPKIWSLISQGRRFCWTM